MHACSYMCSNICVFVCNHVFIYTPPEQILESCRHFLRYSTQHLLPVLEVCFSRLRFSTDAAVAQQPLEQQLDNLDPEVLTVRRSASHTCVNIAKALPDVLVQIFQQLCVSVKAQCDQGQLLDSQQQHLYEMLVIVSNAVPDVATRRAFVMVRHCVTSVTL
jgi:hypothetical protein